MVKQMGWREFERSNEDVKKAEVLKIPLARIHIKEGFNPRDMNKAETKGKILAMKESYKAGRYVPPLEVTLSGDTVYVIDGHCRRIAAGMADEELQAGGNPGIESLICVPFKGNDAAALVHTITGNEGEKLIPIEVAEVVARLVNMGWDRPKIANTFTYSSGWVDKLIFLSTLPEKIKQMIREGKVSTDVAVAAFKEYGEDAVEYLERMLEGETEKVTTKKTPAKKKLSGEKFEMEVFDKVREMLEHLGFDKTDYPIKKIGTDEPYEVVITGFSLKHLMELQDMFVKKAAKEAKAIAEGEGDDNA